VRFLGIVAEAQAGRRQNSSPLCCSCCSAALHRTPCTPRIGHTHARHTRACRTQRTVVHRAVARGAHRGSFEFGLCCRFCQSRVCLPPCPLPRVPRVLARLALPATIPSSSRFPLHRHVRSAWQRASAGSVCPRCLLALPAPARFRRTLPGSALATWSGPWLGHRRIYGHRWHALRIASAAERLDCRCAGRNPWASTPSGLPTSGAIL
jgi:hypothetical protein